MNSPLENNINMLKLHQKVQITQKAWDRQFHQDKNNPNKFYSVVCGPEVITRIEPNYGGQRKAYYLQSFPYVWWDEEDLELIEEIPYECVDTVQVNGQGARVGDIINCTCQYQITELRPVYHYETRKHIKEDPGNNFMYRIMASKDCLIHFRYAK